MGEFKLKKRREALGLSVGGSLTDAQDGELIWGSCRLPSERSEYWKVESCLWRRTPLVRGTVAEQVRDRQALSPGKTSPGDESSEIE